MQELRIRRCDKRLGITSDFSSLTWAVVFGYSLVGTTKLGFFEEKHSQLLLGAAIASQGATRQARSHFKAAVGLGNSTLAVKAVYKAAVRFVAWNKGEIADIDVELLSRELHVTRNAD